MDSSDASKMSKFSGPLAVRKTSCKTGMRLMRPAVQPRPAPRVYICEAADFRSLVQELTGAGPTKPAAPKSKGNSPLRKIAPTPLLPTFSYTNVELQPVQESAAGLPPLPSGPNNGGVGNSFGASLAPVPTLLDLLSPHTFSPLPTLPTNDQMWANMIESATSIAIQRLHKV